MAPTAPVVLSWRNVPQGSIAGDFGFHSFSGRSADSLVRSELIAVGLGGTHIPRY